MIDLIFKILGLLKDYISKNSEDRKKLFDKFLEPAIQDLEAVHKNYLDSFLKYIDVIKTGDSENFSLHPVFEMIVEDSISSSHLREKLYSFYDNTNDSALNNFVTALGKYFRFLGECFSDKIDDEERQIFLSSNVIRHDLYISIETTFKQKRWSKSEKLEQAILKVKKKILILQSNYRDVIDSYNQVKKELLTSNNFS